VDLNEIAQLIERVDAERLTRRLFHLAKDPLPFRKANATLPGHARSTLDEADDYIADTLIGNGYDVMREACRAQAFRCDAAKPMAHQYSPPAPEDDWYTLYNLYAGHRGISRPDEIVLLVAHKDSQSWNDSPGAYDNAVGTVALLEVAEVLRYLQPARSLRFLFCNEEHTPWTSNTAAANARERGDNIVALLNTDALGGKSEEDRAAGRLTNATQYSSSEGERLASLMSQVNQCFNLGLCQSAKFEEHPGDDHGVFFRQGFRAAIMNIGSLPYADPNYHLLSDTPERVDIANVVASTRALLAASLILSLGAENDLFLS